MLSPGMGRGLFSGQKPTSHTAACGLCPAPAVGQPPSPSSRSLAREEGEEVELCSDFRWSGG